MDLPVTQLPHHVADLQTANAMRPPVGGAGLIVGVDATGNPVVVRIFDNEARSYVVVGGLSLLQLLVVRLVALNCRIMVRTERPGAWGTVVRTTAGASGAISIDTGDSAMPAGTPHRPTVLVIDSASGVEATTPLGTAWSAVISGYDSLSQWNAAVLDQVDAAFVHQLSGPETALVERRMALQDLSGALNGNQSGMLGVVSRGCVVSAEIRLTAFERWVLVSIQR